jgi:hypothetical protein
MAKTKGVVFGIGINDASYKVTLNEGEKMIWICPYYTTWSEMIRRCYSAIFLKAHPSHKGSKVCDSWLRFSNFRSWMIQQQWIEFTNDDECNIERKELDKDFLSGEKRGKLYSPKTCIFVSSRINSFLTDCKKTRGKYPLGVYKRGNKYVAGVNNPFTKKKEHLGTFTLPEIAQAFYIARKKEIAQQLAKEETDPRIKQALLSMDFSH